MKKKKKKSSFCDTNVYTDNGLNRFLSCQTYVDQKAHTHQTTYVKSQIELKVRGVFRTQSSIYDGDGDAFQPLNIFAKNLHRRYSTGF